MLRDLAIALSLANLCFINVWRGLLIPASQFYYYHRKFVPPTVEYIAVICAVVVLGGVIFAAIRLVRRSENESFKKAARIGFILFLSVPLYGLLTQLDNSAVQRLLRSAVRDDVVVKRLVVTIPLTICLFLTFIALLKRRRAMKIAVTLSLILAPFVAVTFGQGVLTAIKYRDGSDKASPPLTERKNQTPRVLWMVFDELDYRLAFESRPDTVKLPELDRFANQSLFATNAYPPGGETLLSIPALISGRLISEAHRAGPKDLIIRFGDDSEKVSWGTQPNVFARARSEGFNTATFGWYHPYCRILGDSLNRCDWQGGIPAALAVIDLSGRESVPEGWRYLGWHMREHAKKAAYTIPLASFLFPQKLDVGDLERRKQLQDLETIYSNTVAAATDRSFSLIFSHWGIPHPPNIYDRSTDQISMAPNHSYLDNLELLDQTLGKLRAEMELKGVWDNTTILITSDHWWRPFWKAHKIWTAEDESAMGNTLDRRVPFVLKMPGAATQRVAFDAPFNTVLTQDLLLAILRGEVVDTKGAAAWLEKNRSIGRSPYDDRVFR
jgi:hypothetical protein